MDLLKFILCFCICAIHIQPFPENTAVGNVVIQNGISRVAVPLYFMSSGFLFFRKVDRNNVDFGKVKQYSFKLFRLLGLWTFLTFVGWNSHLWYLGAVALSVFLLSFMFYKKIRLLHIVVVTICLYVFGLLGDSYYGLCEPLKQIPLIKVFVISYDNIFGTTRNGMFFGLIFVLLGALFSYKKIQINQKFAIILSPLSIVLVVLESICIKIHSDPKDYNILISLVPASICTFSFFLNIKLRVSPVWKELRAIGTLVFFLHCIVKFVIVNIAFDIIKNLYNLDLVGFSYIIVVPLTIVIAFFIYRLSQNKWTWLRYLYS